MTEYGVRLTGDGSGLVGATKAVAQAQAGLEDQLKKTQGAAKENANQAAQFVARLKEEADVIGKTHVQIERYRAGQLQLTDAQKASVEASLRKVEAHERVSSALRTVTAGIGVATVAATAYAASTGIAVKRIIDQAAELHNLSQSYGISTETLSAYRYQMALSGVTEGEFSSAMKNLAKNVSEAQAGVGNGAQLFKLLGDELYQAARRGASLEELVPKMAVAFARFADGPNKTALAIQFFGLAGERMIPMLNRSSAGMRVAAAEAAELGRIIGTDTARAADEFNSRLVRMNALLEASKYTIARDALPALDDITARFIRGAKEGGIFYGVLESAREATTTAMTAAAMSRAQGTLDTTNDLIRKREARGVYYGSGDATLQSLYAKKEELEAQLGRHAEEQELARLQKHARALAASAGAFGMRNAPAIPKVGGGPTDYQQLSQQLRDLIAVQQLQLDTTEKLTAAEQVRAKLDAGRAAGTLKLTEAEYQKLRADLAIAHQDELSLRQRELQKKAIEESSRAYSEQVEQQFKLIQSSDEQNKKLREHNEELGLTTEQLGRLKIARAEEALAIAEQNLAITNMHDPAEAELAIAEARVKAAREFVQLVREGAVKEVAVEQAKKAEEEWKRTADNIERALTDALMRGFDKGKSFMQNLRDGMINAFKTAILQPIIQPIVRPVAQYLSSAVGGVMNSFFGGGSNVVSGGGGGLFGGGGLGFPSPGSFMNFGGGLEFAGGFASTAFMPAAEAAALIESGTVGFAGAGMEAGALGLSGAASAIPWVGAALLAANALGLFGGDEQEPPPGFRAPLWARLQGSAAGGFGVGTSELADPGTGMPLFMALNKALNDAGQFDQAILDSLVGTTINVGPGTGSQQMIEQLLQALAPASSAAQGRAAAFNAMLQSGSAFAGGLRGYVDSMTVSEYLSPTDRLSGARSLFEDTLAAAQGGDAVAAGRIPGLAQSLLASGRDVYASGPQFQELFTSVNRELADVLSRQGEQQAQLLADMPVSIREAANDTIAELKKLREQVTSGLAALNAGLRQFQAGAA